MFRVSAVGLRRFKLDTMKLVEPACSRRPASVTLSQFRSNREGPCNLAPWELMLAPVAAPFPHFLSVSHFLGSALLTKIPTSVTVSCLVTPLRYLCSQWSQLNPYDRKGSPPLSSISLIADHLIPSRLAESLSAPLPRNPLRWPRLKLH